MLYWSLIFLVVALISAIFGFTDLASDSARVAKIFFAIFLVMFLASFAIQLLG